MLNLKNAPKDNTAICIDTIDASIARLEAINVSVDNMAKSIVQTDIKTLLNLQKEAASLSQSIQTFIRKSLSELA